MNKSTLTKGTYATISATGASAAATRLAGAAEFGFACVASTVTTGATFQVEGRRSVNGVSTAYVPLTEFDIPASGTYSVPADPPRTSLHAGEQYDEYRINCLSRTDGSYVFTTQAITNP